MRRLLERRWRRALVRRTSPSDEEQIWTALGEWLRRFHAADKGDSLPPRMTRRDELVEHVQRSREFLLRAGAEPGPVHRLAGTVAERAE